MLGNFGQAFRLRPVDTQGYLNFHDQLKLENNHLDMFDEDELLEYWGGLREFMRKEPQLLTLSLHLVQPHVWYSLRGPRAEVQVGQTKPVHGGSL